MGMFDSYYISKDFKCPDCGTEHKKEQDFQSKDGACVLASYALGDKIDPSLRFWDFYSYCEGKYDRSDYDKPRDKNGEFPVIKATCKNGDFNCRVYINEQGVAYREVVTMNDGEKGIKIYENNFAGEKK